MAINPGSSVGPYEIVGALGAGGMGEVYKGRDSRLNRDVAIKVLPLTFAADPDRRARFEREAQAIASLSHPNILAIFDTGIHEGQLFIVTELLDGETLRAQIGSVTVRRAIDIGVQIARGLTAAHDKGLVHRDLKPENLFLLTDGQVKILDFGLARQTNAPSGAAVTGAPTAAGLTDPGIALGTAGYMAPEQVRGAELDYRADIFAFGAILYEMLSGRRAFERETSAETMTAILKEDPPELAASGLHISPGLDRIVRRCLEKQPRLRFQSAADLGFALEAAATPTGASAVMTAPVNVPARSRKSWLMTAAAFGLGFVAAIAFAIGMAGPAKPDPSAFRFSPFSFEAGSQGNPVWSPDGKAVAYNASTERPPQQVFVRYLDQPVGKQLTQFPEGAMPVQWTPDGRRIVFVSSHKPAGLWSVAVVGGEPESVMELDARSGSSAVIANDFSAAALLHSESGGKIGVWISAPVGAPLKKYVPDPFATQIIYNRASLAFSPDKRHILLFLNSGDRGREEAWLMPFPADAAHPPQLIFQDLSSWSGTPQFSWMPDSRHVVVALQTEFGSVSRLFIADTMSKDRVALPSQTVSMVVPRVSPDGDRLIFTQPSGSLDIVSLNVETVLPQRLVSTERGESMPAWAQNQPALVYVTDRSGPPEIWLRSADGGTRPLVTAANFPSNTTQWFMTPALSPKADRVIYIYIPHEAGSAVARLWISSVSGGAPVPLTNDGGLGESGGDWSPDGNWFVYLVVRAGKIDLMKVKTSGQSAPVLLKADINRRNVSLPSWSPNGEWIEYNDKGENLISPDGKNSKFIGDLKIDGCTFSHDSRLLYCLRFDLDHETLFSVDISTGAQKTIGTLDGEFRPTSNLNPGIRLSLAPDGKSIVYGHSRSSVNNLWLLEGLAPKAGLLNRLRWWR